ncbi:hypothetical protein [Ectothiorhodospira sp. BSL-9]|uniref:hypothetical protein n=1 Tax=Ectothiorhodospira sp. BSL-9 TaxID=1442136 RepID=UPI0007B44C1B|nr:hypothetical protein [Ectothiorhodospira sp. BSL-9]ANB02065.1 hypothetical protein ECTOBSL9_1345 [Ectothiorhodospira sp. BSL-9]ANB02236.1 hypothetical protein ECTOBSL9_1580 [Ectothiorhodospira sp. BSL-9]ANB03011.1 hypothetical protein ECTOBSL9_2557 [Ectothiorhodospira sp. BSL-9]ANB03016.1 hypothetical protein ECTOBSL9_2563 [Ectothiorhodospira sp. BSL-9]
MNTQNIEKPVLPPDLDPDTVRALHTVLLNLVDHLESVYFAQLRQEEERPDNDVTTPRRACRLPGDEPPF